MSNEVALALMAGSIFPGYLGYMYTAKLANALTVQIVSGVADGVPMPAEWRWRLLYGRWVYYVAVGVGISFVVAAFNFKIARFATDDGVKAVAYLVAFFGALVAVGWMVSSISELAYYRRVLSETTKD